MAIPYDPSHSALFTPDQRDTIFQAGKIYSATQLAVEAARLAYIPAEASDAQRARLVDALSRVALTDLVTFVDAPTGAAAFAARRAADGAALLSFRGTQPGDARDIWADLSVKPVDWTESAGRVHAGFASATRALVPSIREWIQGTNVDLGKLIVTGHSLGAAMATLASTIWRPRWLITIGSPRVGNEDFVATVTALSSVRMVNCCDGVTRVPPSVGGYVHLAACSYVTREAVILENPSDEVIDADRERARVAYLVDYTGRGDAVPVRDLADHAPINYARAVFS